MFFLFCLARALDRPGSIGFAPPESGIFAFAPSSKVKSRLCLAMLYHTGCTIAAEFYVIRKNKFLEIWQSTWISRILLQLKDNSVTSKMRSNPFFHINWFFLFIYNFISENQALLKVFDSSSWRPRTRCCPSTKIMMSIQTILKLVMKTFTIGITVNKKYIEILMNNLIVNEFWPQIRVHK